MERWDVGEVRGIDGFNNLVLVDANTGWDGGHDKSRSIKTVSCALRIEIGGYLHDRRVQKRKKERRVRAQTAGKREGPTRRGRNKDDDNFVLTR